MVSWMYFPIFHYYKEMNLLKKNQSIPFKKKIVHPKETNVNTILKLNDHFRAVQSHYEWI